METNEAFEALKTFLIQNYGAKAASGGREIIKRCHICGDSRDPSSRHMYIGLRDGVILYNCFKCNASGVVDSKFFRDLGCYDVDMINICNKNNAKGSSLINQNKSSFYRKRIPNLTITEDSRTMKKLEYINNRLGIRLKLSDLAEFKIVPNLYDYLNHNDMPRLTRYKDVCDQLDLYFLGFLSADNAYLIMRRLVDKNEVLQAVQGRYVNYNIYDLKDNSYRYYILPGFVDPTRHIRINIAEGPFDILGVRFNTNAHDYNNSIYAAIGGKSYINLVKFFITEYGFMNFELHIYADNDVDNYEIEKISTVLNPYRTPIYLHRNTFPGEKDYGVTSDHIIDSMMQIL